MPTRFRTDGFAFELLAREGKIALFRKTKFYRHASLLFETYEVVIVQERGGPNGDTTPGQWGLYGWSLQSLERARELFRNREVEGAA